MRNLNGRFLILVGEGSFEWPRLLPRSSVELHEQRVMTGQEPREGAIFMPEVCQALGVYPLRFLGFDAGELACSVF